MSLGARPRIAIVNQPFDGILPPVQNSIGIWTYEVARRIADRCDVTVYGRRSGHVPGRTVEDQGVSYRFVSTLPGRVWARLDRFWKRVGRARRPLYASQLFYLEYSVRVAWLIRRSRPDVVHIHNLTGFVPVIRALNPNRKLVLHMSCEWLSQLDASLMSRRIGKVNAVFGTSKHVTGLVQQRFPQHASKCHTVYNGVDAETFSPGPQSPAATVADEHVVLFVGRVSPEKGVHDLVEALPMVLDDHPDTLLEIVGPRGVLSKEYIIDVSEDELVLGLERWYPSDYTDTLIAGIAERCVSHVEFVGGLAHADVAERYRRADILVNPSYTESFGMSLIEAMACGIPVVATRVGGMTEIVDDTCGVLVARGDPAALAAAINGLLSNKALRTAMGRFGRQRVLTCFSWDHISNVVLAHYAALAANAVPAAAPSTQPVPRS